jgi:hypothetical protein
MLCPACGREATFTPASGIGYDADTGDYSYQGGKCSECHAVIDQSDLDRIHEEETKIGRRVLAAACPMCKAQMPDVSGYTPAIELTLPACGHYGCRVCVVECLGCLRPWCDNCLYLCLDCGQPVCPECAVPDADRRMFHAACAPQEVQS